MQAGKKAEKKQASGGSGSAVHPSYCSATGHLERTGPRRTLVAVAGPVSGVKTPAPRQVFSNHVDH